MGGGYDIPFRSEFELMDGWNGDYTVQGQTLHISSKDYNGNIPSGGSAVDIGFIVRGGDGILE